MSEVWQGPGRCPSCAARIAGTHSATCLNPILPKITTFPSVTKETVNHPRHYNDHPSGIECIAIIEHFALNIGTAVKYLWRAGLKSPDAIEDLKKARWYVQREIERLEAGGVHPVNTVTKHSGE